MGNVLALALSLAAFLQAAVRVMRLPQTDPYFPVG
jgi:hypothetical protein